MENKEQEPATETPKKRCNKPAIILGIVAVLGIGAAAYFGIQYFGEKDRADKLAAQTTAQPTDEMEQTDGSKDKVADGAVKYWFDTSKIVNSKDGDTLRGDVWGDYLLYDSFLGIELSLYTSSQNVLELTFLNEEEVYKSYGLAKGSTTEKKIKFNKKIGDFKICQFGQAVGNEMIVVILEDGTAEYIPMYEMLKEQKYSSYGTVDGISNAVKFYEVNAGGADNMIQTSDGKIYSLHDIFEEMGVM